MVITEVKDELFFLFNNSIQYNYLIIHLKNWLHQTYSQSIEILPVVENKILLLKREL